MSRESSFRSKPRKRKSPYEKAGIGEEESKGKGGLIYKQGKKPKGKVVPVWCNDSELMELDNLKERRGYTGRSETIKWALKLAKINEMSKEYQESELAKEIIAKGLDVNSIKRKVDKMVELE